MPLAETAAGHFCRHGASSVLHGDTWRSPFRPLTRNGDLQTVLGRYWPRDLDETTHPGQQRLVATEPGTSVLVRWNEQLGSRREAERPILLSLHGLTACDRAPYMLSTARAALDGGFDSARMNMRNCGGTEHLCPTLYHSGLTSDLDAVARQLAPRPVFLTGFSMGGNVALKLAGEWGAKPPDNVLGVCAISPPVQLAMCSKNIGRPRNLVYELRFLRQLRAAVRRKRSVMPGAIPGSNPEQVRSIWEFDEAVTAPAFGFRDAADYYRNCSAAHFLHAVRIPTLVIQARDDPFVPFEAFDLPAFRSNDSLRLLSPRHGGHVAFLAKGPERFWAQREAVRFFQALARERGLPSRQATKAAPYAAPAAPRP